ncbi:SpoIIE family protein phosphatase [Actinacidiphila acidipaludis]|uniref:SpoIIE family protein phosphatase n=1 Tax=Actinacidiphila acidipaludis TaxID=2873382 RepID=A0ABS7Q2D1_9ACTN|nr:SpoIIE family protein phosphatase [Streptomyces acidipaludis]MBY8877301.1 SpoIIE family protein phosphatase [Streptomyces acidipaludis]
MVDSQGAGRRRPSPVEPGRGLGDVLDSIDAGAYALDDRGLITAMNPRGEMLLARSASDIVGQDAHDLLHRDGDGKHLDRSACPVLRAMLAGRTTPEQASWLERGDGSILPVSWLATPFRREDETTGALVVFHQRSGAEADREQGLAVASLSELERLALLAETTSRLTSTLDPDLTLRRLAHIVVPRLADWLIVDLRAENDEVWRTLVAHLDDGVLTERSEFCGPLPPMPEGSTLPLAKALRGAASTVATPATYERHPASGIAVEQQRMFAATGIRSAVIGPIRGPREVLGALTLGRVGEEAPFTDDDRALLDDIALRTGISLENARLYQRQVRVAETMQHHLLPKLPLVPGLETTVRYVSAPHASQVGGDWYDMFPLRGESFALAIGDVAGHDLDAAAGMAQLRNMLRAHAWTRPETPGSIVGQLDEIVRHLTDVTMATLVFGRLRHDPADGWSLQWTNAGHPPPLLIDYHGRARFLEEAHGLLLGTGTSPERPDATTALPPRSTLLLYTDGLIEEPGASLDEGLERLRRHAAALAHRRLDVFCDQLLQRVRPAANDDDVAMLALRVPGTQNVRQ